MLETLIAAWQSERTTHGACFRDWRVRRGSDGSLWVDRRVGLGKCLRQDTQGPSATAGFAAEHVPDDGRQQRHHGTHENDGRRLAGLLVPVGPELP